MSINRKLTDEDKKIILELRKEGLSYPAIAARFDVSQHTILRVCNPESYKRQMEANKRYRTENASKVASKRKESSKTYRMVFFKKTDADVIQRLDEQDNMQNYVRELVREDIQRDKSKDPEK